jgi:FemAB-related protein (PEP-CTERM system-associated)
MTMLDVRALDMENAAQRDSWDAYVNARGEATAFHRSAWGRAIHASMGHGLHYLAAYHASRIVGILPLIHVKSRLFGNSLSSLSFAVYGGPVADTADVHAALDAAAWDLAQKLGISALEYRHEKRSRPDWTCKSETYATFRKPLLTTRDDNLKAIPRKQRAEVRKAMDKGLTVSIEKTADAHYRVYSESVRNLGTPVFPKTLFEALLRYYGPDADVLTVSKDGTPAASVLSLYHRGEVLPYYGGGTAEARDLRANDHMYFELMNHAVARGCTSFDFGRSKFGTGAFAFKKNWGFEPTPLCYEYRLAEGATMPDLNPNNPKYKLMVDTWQKLPLPVANWLGPKIARSLG